MVEIQLKTKDGKEGKALLPENIEELMSVFGIKHVFKSGLAAYKTRCLRQIKNGSKPREKTLKIKLADLSDAQKAALLNVGLLGEE